MADRHLEHLLRPHTAGTGLEVTAVDRTTAQIVWSHLDEGPHELVVDARVEPLMGSGGPGSLLVEDLRPGTRHRLTLRSPDPHDATMSTVLTRDVPTLASPGGEELFRFATISDLHLGRGDREYRGPLARALPEPDSPRDPATGDGRSGGTRYDPQLQCARDAVAEAVAWGAQLLVIKGDLCEQTFEQNWDLAADLLDDLPIPVVILPGNHDTGSERRFEPEHGAEARGLSVTRGIDHLDVPGLRILLVDSTVPGTGWGTLDRHVERASDLAADATAGVFVATHHQAQRFAIPLYWPHGIPGPEARRFARAMRAANPSVLISSGHTHRCRHRRVAGAAWSEVAATNHFPGVWAGYTVHEGGLTQSVRRIVAPEALAWTEHTRAALGGVWALWAAGELDDRCFTLRW